MGRPAVRLEQMVRHFRFAARFLARTPAFTLPAVASLALGIAANTTILSVVDAMLLRPLGAGNGDLVRIGRSIRDDRSFRSIEYEHYRSLREQVKTLSGLMGYQIESVALGGSDGAETLSAELVTANYFTVLGVAPRRGRGFLAEEESAGSAARVVVVSDRLWQRQLGGDPAALGSGLLLNDVRFTIIGIAPPGFTGSFPGVSTDLWIPATTAALVVQEPAAPGLPSLAVIGRLTPGIPLETVEADLQGLGSGLREAGSLGKEESFSVDRARGAIPALAQVLRVFLGLLMAVVAVVLLIACANVASLLLARASARRGEVAVRMALGARRGQIAAQLLAESFLLALLGGAAGLLLTLWPIRLLNNWSPMPGPTGAPIFLGLEINGRVLMFTAAVTVLTTLAFGLAPALQATHLQLPANLKDARLLTGRRRSRLRSGLMVAQVGLSFVLLVAAVLLFRSLENSASMDPGFDPDGVVVATMHLQPLRYTPEHATGFRTELLDRVRALPWADQAALADFVPMVGGSGHPQQLSIPGRTRPTPDSELTVRVGRVSEQFFAAVGQPLLRGRDFERRDARSGSPPVAIVNEAMARRYWPGQDVLGERFGLGEGLPQHEIIGVARNARFTSFGGEIDPLVYLPSLNGTRLFVRTAVIPADALSGLREVVRTLDSRVEPHLTGFSLRELMAGSPGLIPVRVAQTVFGVAGGIALVLAAGGLYGLVSYNLQQRLKEIGIRVAMGADRRRVFGLIVGGAARLTLIGIVAGALLALVVMRLLAAMLYGLSPGDPLTFAAIALLLGLVTLLAGYAGARRGLDTDPMTVLREE